MEGLLPVIISLLSGAAGGNLAGSLMKNFNLGTLWNSVVGIVGCEVPVRDGVRTLGRVTTQPDETQPDGPP